MLKRLELVGFKSFADKTQFDFPAGITAIVGPNGSGKSNVVDAVRWVLGEQSAKSLRGGEMADVIFNGSSSRRSLGLAEVTMTFDNSRHVLGTESEEVQITRRVYRSGEGEYLINQQPSRLRDIKNLFLGSGAGNDAYSIIEQGRVDVLLQASTVERRAIFEEAAGISRFKAKKIETLRKLERVDQNLERLRDIIEEVEKQLRSVKLAAAKAERYQEYTSRLRELKVGLGLQEYQTLAEGLNTATSLLESLRASLVEETAQAEAWDREFKRLQAVLDQLDASVREQEAGLATARQHIATEETALQLEWDRADSLEKDAGDTRLRLAELTHLVSHLGAEALHLNEELQEAETRFQDQDRSVRSLEENLQAANRRQNDLTAQIKADRDRHYECLDRQARLSNDAVSYKSRLDGLREEYNRKQGYSAKAVEKIATLDVELERLTSAEQELEAQLEGLTRNLADLRREREHQQGLHTETTTLQSNLKAQHSGLASRIEVLEGLERSYEGLGTGVREVVGLLAQPDPGIWRTVVGMVADLLTVRREYAPLIDLALGETAQCFLVRDVASLESALRDRALPFSGRVSFVPLDVSENDAPSGRANRLIEVSVLGRVRMPLAPSGAPAHPGVVALAEQLVHCEQPELATLPAQLLRHTLLVRDLSVARAIATHTTGYRFVTLQGELLEADGTLTVGTYHPEAGLLSRKSELRELRLQITALDRRIQDTEHDLSDLAERLDLLKDRVEAVQQEIQVRTRQLGDRQSLIKTHREKHKELHKDVEVTAHEIRRLEEELGTLEAQWHQAQAEAEAALAQVRELEARIQQSDHEVHVCDQECQRWRREHTDGAVTLAQTRERLTGLRNRHAQLEKSLQERKDERLKAEQRGLVARSHLEESQRGMLRASAALAQYFLDKEAAEGRLKDLSAERDARRQERQELSERTESFRTAWQARQEEVHGHELEVNNLRHRRDTLVERLREDYQLDLAELYEQRQASPESQPPTLQPTDARKEIDELEGKRRRLGNVNFESIQELADLEARAGSLKVQFDDLTAAKRSLEEIINKINDDSRRLFTDTFATIRTHFQELFRKLFGGGMADIVLENEADILESGIEIVARPPGKELRSISLMSGGEKTMTAVALLLAIFRSKPSPFCILDEVDAALDEANVGRFNSVLREFLDLSQFIIITHSKRTMSCADVLYGVTMQESGISKRVAVRFEDWPDEGPPETVTSNGDLGAFGGK